MGMLESVLQSSLGFFIKGLIMECFRSEGIVPVIRDSSMNRLYIGAMVEASFFRVCRGSGSDGEEYLEVIIIL